MENEKGNTGRIIDEGVKIIGHKVVFLREAGVSRSERGSMIKTLRTEDGEQRQEEKEEQQKMEWGEYDEEVTQEERWLCFQFSF